MAKNASIGDMIPLFTLPSITGEEISLARLKGARNLIVYLFDADCEPCLGFLDSLVEIAPDCRELQTEIIAVGSKSNEELASILQERQFPFPIVGDATGDIWRRYDADGITLIAADRFGEIRQRTESDGEILPDPQQLLAVLSLVELECPECGIATWRP
jgi:peroxiredoxin